MVEPSLSPAHGPATPSALGRAPAPCVQSAPAPCVQSSPAPCGQSSPFPCGQSAPWSATLVDLGLAWLPIAGAPAQHAHWLRYRIGPALPGPWQPPPALQVEGLPAQALLAVQIELQAEAQGGCVVAWRLGPLSDGRGRVLPAGEQLLAMADMQGRRGLVIDLDGLPLTDTPCWLRLWLPRQASGWGLHLRALPLPGGTRS